MGFAVGAYEHYIEGLATDTPPPYVGGYDLRRSDERRTFECRLLLYRLALLSFRSSMRGQRVTMRAMTLRESLAKQHIHFDA